MAKSNWLNPANIPLYESCADFLWQQSRFNCSAVLFGAIDQYRQQAGMPRHPRYQPYYAQILEQLRQQLGEVEFEHVYHAGQVLGIARACQDLESMWSNQEE